MRLDDVVPHDPTALVASSRSGGELVFILVAGFVLYRVLEHGKRRRRSNDPPGRTTPAPPSSTRGSAAEQEDDAVAWWFTSGRYGEHDAGPDGDHDGPDRG